MSDPLMDSPTIAPETPGSQTPTGNNPNEVIWQDDPAPVAEPAPAAIDPATPPAPEAPIDPNSPTVSTLENGDFEVKLPTGAVYRGKTESEAYMKLAAGKVEADRMIADMKRAQAPARGPVQQPDNLQIDASALAVADLLAPAFGVKNGAELIAQFQNLQNGNTQYQQLVEQQQAQATAAEFFRRVPDFPKLTENTEKVDQMLADRGLPFTVENAEMVHHYLKSTGQYVMPPPPAARAANGTFAPKNTMPMPPSGNAPQPGTGMATDAEIFAMSSAEADSYFAKMFQTA